MSMPPAAVRTIEDLLFWQYAKIIAKVIRDGERLGHIWMPGHDSTTALSYNKPDRGPDCWGNHYPCS